MQQEVNYNQDVVRPMECFTEGWRILQGSYWLFWLITFVGMLLASFAPMAILFGPMLCGIYLSFLSRLKDETVTMETLFKGFNFFGESVVATLLQMGVLMLATVPVAVIAFFLLIGQAIRVGSEEGSSSEFIVPFAVIMTLLLILLIAFNAFFIFSYQLIVDRGLSGYEGVKTSIKAVSANLAGVLGLVLINMLIGLIGLLFFYIGLFFVLPLVFAANTVAYRKVFPARSTPAEENSVSLPD